MEVTEESTREEKPLNQFPGWKKVLHPSRPVVAARQVPLLLRSPKQRPCSQSSGKGWLNNGTPMSQRCRS